MGSRKPKSSKRKSSKALQSKRSRRNKSKKKPSRHDHSDLSYSDDDSVSSVSSYSSSSEEDYRSRKGRSRSRADVKSKKKRAERRVSSDRGSSEDSVPTRKRKRSRRKHNSEYKRKSQKKRRRDASISSATSDSLSCSSCDSEYESLRVRSRKKIRDKRDSDKHKIGARRSRSKSRSKSVSSPPSEDRFNFHSDSQKGEEHECENNVRRRLRSVITVVQHPQEDEENQVARDREEDISENNDSDNGSTINKLAYHSDILSDKSRLVEDTPVQESSGSDDLELILRQKALENLKKFRGMVQTEGSKDVHLTGESSRHGLSREVLHPTLVESENATEEYKKVESGVTKQSHIQQSDSSGISKSVNGDGGINEPIVDESKPGLQAMQDESLHSYSTLEQASPKANPDCKSSAGKILAPSCQPLTHNSAKAEPTSSIRPVEDQRSENQQAEPTSSVRPVEDQRSEDQQAEPTSSIRAVEDQSSKGQQAEANDSSHFQQKTMSVMRSGEMVQVSYKVYIPKRAPALSRRQLKR
ncbi:PREDICTED: uncharacterized protein LOC109188300 [Ipomoea nil]|uniref:uncharacterized protein LOC109188300 n=1 Tax=Ipomoea nil TaxID=35883 RepID=UPI0009017ED3|nr:PREDICTED: uncharacterized protein LOC109188300 [Ipomoea nil]